MMGLQLQDHEESLKADGSRIQSLPNEILTKTFLLLGIKQTAQLLCVCRSWRELLTNHYFVQQYYNQCIFLKNYGDVFSTNLTNLLKQDDRSIEFDYLSRMEKISHNWVASTNGLVCIRIGTVSYPSYVLSYGFTLTTPEIIVNNYACPSDFKSCYGIRLDTGYGFGYDRDGDDYKIVALRIFYYKPSQTVKTEWIVRIYSLKHNTWKDIVEHPFSSGFMHDLHAEYSHGCLYWIMTSKMVGSYLIRYDLCKEEFAPIILLPDDAPKYVGLTTLDGEISIYNTKRKGPNNFDVWLLQLVSYCTDDGPYPRFSWTKLVSLPPPEAKFKKLRPVTYLKAQNVVLLLGEDFWREQLDPKLFLSWYHIDERKIIRTIKVPNRSLKRRGDQKVHQALGVPRSKMQILC